MSDDRRSKYGCRKAWQPTARICFSCNYCKWSSRFVVTRRRIITKHHSTNPEKSFLAIDTARWWTWWTRLWQNFQTSSSDASPLEAHSVTQRRTIPTNRRPIQQPPLSVGHSTTPIETETALPAGSMLKSGCRIGLNSLISASTTMTYSTSPSCAF
jgi:hypothetical protein